MERSRRTQEERRSATRKKLAETAFALIRDEGYANFRVAAVARAAGVSQGGQLHHFPTKEAMTMAAITHGLGIAQARTAANLAGYRAGKDLLEALVEDSKDYYFSAAFDVAMDIVKGVSANRDMRRNIARLHRNYRRATEQSWARLFVESGWEPAAAADVVAMTTSMVRGLAIRSMLRRDDEQTQHLLDRFRALIGNSRGSGAADDAKPVRPG